MPCSESVALLPQPIAFQRRAVASIASGSLQTKRQNRVYRHTRKFVDGYAALALNRHTTRLVRVATTSSTADTPPLRSPGRQARERFDGGAVVRGVREWTAYSHFPTQPCWEARPSLQSHRPRSIRKQNWRRCSHCSHPMPPLPTLQCSLSCGRIPTAKAVLSQGRNELLTGLGFPSGPSETSSSAWNELGSLRGEFRISQPVQHDAQLATRCRRDRDRVLSARPMSSLRSNHCPL